VLLAEQYDCFTNEIDWNSFWNKFILAEQNIHSLLVESFTLKDRTEFSDVYDIATADNAQHYMLYVNVHPVDAIANRIIGSYTADIANREQYKTLLGICKTNTTCLNVTFTDSEQNVHQTHNAKNKAFTVLSGLKKAVNASMFDRNVKPEVLFFYVLKEDNKKL
jgi:hypothetical protein